MAILVELFLKKKFAFAAAAVVVDDEAFEVARLELDFVAFVDFDFRLIDSRLQLCACSHWTWDGL